MVDVKYGVVLGCPRSGTTFLMQVLETVPDVACVTGNLLPICIPHLVNQPLAEDHYAALCVAFEKTLTDYLESGMFNARASSLRKWFVTKGKLRDLPAALKQRERSVEQIIYKEPFLTFAPQYTYEALPQARIVHIHRDGRDCANSLVRSYDVLSDDKLTHLKTSEMPLGRKWDHRYVPWWVDAGDEAAFLEASPYLRAVWMWKAMVVRAHAFFHAPDVQASGRVLHVAYEALMRDPIAIGRIVCDHLGLTRTAQTEKVLQTAHERSIGSYRRHPEAVQKAAWDLAGDALEQWGYTP